MNMLKPALATILFVVTILSFCAQDDIVQVSERKVVTVKTISVYTQDFNNTENEITASNLDNLILY